MIVSKVQKIIKRPPEEVFDYITDPAKSVLWQSSVAEIQASPGLTKGSSGMVVMGLFGRRMVSRFEVIENDGHSYYRARSTQGPIEYDSTQRVDPVPEGSQVSFVTKIDAGTVFRLAETALQAIAKARFEADLETLKALLENQEPNLS